MSKGEFIILPVNQLPWLCNLQSTYLCLKTNLPESVNLPDISTVNSKKYPSHADHMHF